MKLQTDVRSKPIMRFFTPELYLRFNSSDDEAADRADEEWEGALRAYQNHLEGMRNQMPQQVRKLAELCLHDCDLLGWDEATEPDLRSLSEPFPVWSAFSVLSLRRDKEILSLNYVLWDKVRRHAAPREWPFSTSQAQWLYDEIDIASGKTGMFLHRVLFSDGTTAEIPFAIVIIHVVAVESPRADGALP